MKNQVEISPLMQDDFETVIALGNLVHGDGYLDEQMLSDMQDKAYKSGINANFVAYRGGELVGFRLTYAPGNWSLDRWCSPTLWPVAAEDCCYFKCNTVSEEARGLGIGKALLQSSIEACKAQGALAGVSHLWKQSPDNSAVGYFTNAGGKLIKEHPERWNNNPDHPDYVCVLCGSECHCVACEMILIF
ncbi:GNAT family N-acetyltransferase [Shewanella sp. Isolate7]|uniref:GNAT family N-acetyltransferase n=1 Tax=Shewanella sp. Isolate7 TaxID=2908528 RepID=UPI001EFCC6C0|nr:GNAT family N-acetyltransferase [Shewanella sp. Isolate7]MCG9722047.1 GNAT family N-acetyltransferase [Shewanella sp. Isolate7]